MGDDGHIDAVGEVAEHRAQHRERRVRAAGGARLQDHRRALGLRGHGIGAHVLPAEADEARHRVAVPDRGAQDLGEGRECHLNFATMSMIPGIVWSCAAWVGWKYCFRLR
jgi:hypothetical protein